MLGDALRDQFDLETEKSFRFSVRKKNFVAVHKVTGMADDSPDHSLFALFRPWSQNDNPITDLESRNGRITFQFHVLIKPATNLPSGGETPFCGAKFFSSLRQVRSAMPLNGDSNLENHGR